MPKKGSKAKKEKKDVEETKEAVSRQSYVS